MLAGARSYVAIGEWARRCRPRNADRSWVGPVVACEFTFRRMLQTLDADALDDALGAWTRERTCPPAGHRRRIAVDGKTLRGSGAAGEPARHLLAAFDHAHGVVLGPFGVEAKANELRGRCAAPGWVGIMGDGWPGRRRGILVRMSP